MNIMSNYIRQETFCTFCTFCALRLQVHQALIDGLTPSNGFSYVTGGQPDPADDLRPYNITSPENFQFIAQASDISKIVSYMLGFHRGSNSWF